MHRFLALPIAFAAAVLARGAAAGPVVVGDGVVDMHYETPAGADDRRFNFSGPGGEALRYTGSPLPGEELGGVRGDSVASYEIVETEDGGTFDVDILSSVLGPVANATGGRVDFGVTFVTDRDLRYSLVVDPHAPGQMFRTTFADVDAFLSVDVFGEVDGNLVENGEPAAKTFEGILRAGAHVLAMEVISVNGRDDDGGITAGRAQLTLVDAGVTPIPLPPAVWGAATILPLGALRSLRALRRRGQS
jgi:hypothetical protein